MEFKHDVVIGLVAGAFSAGITFALWVGTRPSRDEVSIMVQPAITASKAAQAQAFSTAQEVRAMRVDLARGFGRALARPGGVRDEAGKSAVRMFDRERAEGVPPEVAMQHVLESDF